MGYWIIRVLLHPEVVLLEYPSTMLFRRLQRTAVGGILFLKRKGTPSMGFLFQHHTQEESLLYQSGRPSHKTYPIR